MLAEQVLRRALAFAEKNPAANFPRLLTIARLVATQENHKAQITQLADLYQSNPVVHSYLKVLQNSHPNVKNRLLYNWFVNNLLLGIPRQRTLSARLGVNVPNLLLVDPTSACNLTCAGCWAGKYSDRNSLAPQRLDRLFGEAKELSIHWIVLSGGEPLAYPHLFDLLAKHRDMAFMAYTNGTLINEKVADRIVEVGNFTPAISLEGFAERTDARRGAGTFARVTRAMDLLRERGAIFGVSLTATRHNVEEITSDEFIDFLIAQGVVYGWIFHYIPIGRNPDVDLMVTPAQRAYLAERVPSLRAHKPIMLCDFWNDGEYTEGCIAGGRRYLHINAAGEVEPCAFVHFAADNINRKTLLEVLRSPFFAAFQKRQPFHRNHLRPCPVIDNPAALREIVRETGARPTHEGAQTILEGFLAACLDRRAAEWGRVADGIWAQRRGHQKAEGF
ncbi:MAG: radical SAM protein [Moorella sp. (in: Bacteria)]|nr:radical SAM protein [Moorella sp. (in: firmicutes)]